MDQKTFVERLCWVVLDNLSRDLVEYWQHPPGRLRSETRSRRAKWLGSMNAEDRELLEAFGTEAARSALFGILAVLDGSRAIEGAEEGHLELRYLGANRSGLLASSAIESDTMPLHELLP
ncbi:MAG: hypothetical protein KGM49_07310 [Sphingomonadales bacterium]|nr:hypothetical protein [Sphingomonadales bacterium]